jgi:predicted DNA-binding transcriptional regulator YafY
MSSDHHRVSRLIRMASEIKTNPQQEPPALIKALGISKPQFYKDKTALEKLGFSFRFDRAQKRFIIDRDPYIPIYDLTLTETFALVMAVRQLSATGDFILTYDALNAVRKIASNSPQDQRQFLRSCLDDVVLKEGFGCDSKVLADLQNAVKECRGISILYDLYSEGGIKDYTIDPCQLYFKRRALYVDAYAPEEKGYRVYRVNRIRRVTPHPMIVPGRKDYSFARRHRSSFSTFVGDTVEKVTVRFSKRIAPYIRETCWHGSQKITSQKDGCILFEVEVSEPKEVGWWVLQWGAEAEVLKPESLRRELQETAEHLLTLYGRKKQDGDKTQAKSFQLSQGGNDGRKKKHGHTSCARIRWNY